jgi:hypothetical protein
MIALQPGAMAKNKVDIYLEIQLTTHPQSQSIYNNQNLVYLSLWEYPLLANDGYDGVKTLNL